MTEAVKVQEQNEEPLFHCLKAAALQNSYVEYYGRVQGQRKKSVIGESVNLIETGFTSQNESLSLFKSRALRTL